MNIRAVVAEDAASLSDLVEELGYSSTAADAARRLTALRGRDDHEVFVAVESSRAIGFIHVCVVETLENDPYAQIRALSVGEAHRGRGIGRELVEVAEEWARERGLPRMRVRSNVKRERARKFYERHGYEVTKTQNVFDKKL